MTSIVMDLWIEAMGADRAIAYSRRKEWYATGTRYRHSAFTYTTVTRSVDILAREGLIDSFIAPAIGPTGFQSTMRARPELLTIVLPEGLHYALDLEVRLRWGGELVDYRDTTQTLRMRKGVRAINEGLDSITYDIPGADKISPAVWKVGNAYLNPAQRTLYRSFNQDWSLGGRFYGASWIGCPKEYRRGITIDGQPTTEEDYPAHHLRIAYAQQGRVMPSGDPYTVEGFTRDVGKAAMQTLLNAKNYQSARYATAGIIEQAARNDPNYDGPLSDESLSSATKLLAGLKAMHRHIADLFHTGIGLRFQRLDSDMMARVQLTLQRRGVVGLPVHDSIIVPLQYAGLARESMEEAFSHVMGRAA